MISGQIYTFLLSVLIQLIAIFGGFFVFGFILSFLQDMIQKNYMKAMGWRGILWTAWIGTPVHELGHIFFAKIFGHRITKVSLFKPDRETGTLGETGDTYSRWSVFQNIGNFFIGVGPLIFSSLVLAALLYLLVPNHAEVFNALRVDELNLINIWGAIYWALIRLFAFSNLSHFGFWIFLYLSFAIASHMAPSKIDLKRALSGFSVMVIVIILLNLLFIALGFDIGGIISGVATYINAFLVFLIYALDVSIIHLLVSFIILGAARFTRRVR